MGRHSFAESCPWATIAYKSVGKIEIFGFFIDNELLFECHLPMGNFCSF